MADGSLGPDLGGAHMIIVTHGPDKNASPDIFASADTPFVSPFFSRDASGSPRFKALLGEASSGVVANQGAIAWQEAMMRATKSILQSPNTGGMPFDIVRKIIQTSGPNLSGQLVSGLFAPAFEQSVVPNIATKEPLLDAAIQMGLDIAVNAISAVPIVGNVIGAVVSIAKALVSLFKKSPPEVALNVPWQEYSRNVDEDLINNLVVDIIAPSVDWTNFFAPPMPAGPFTLEPAGPGKRAAGVFVHGAACPTQTGRDPCYTSGLGYMPGTQRMVEVVQVARTYQSGQPEFPSSVRDAVTNVGDFYPATAQWGTVAWGMVEASAKNGTGADLYKIQASALIGKWADYWGAYFEDLIDAIIHYPHYDNHKLFLAKVIAKFLTFETYQDDANHDDVEFVDPEFITTSRNLQGFVDENIFSTGNTLSPGRQFLRPDESLTTPALERVRARQFGSLTTSLSCAYVRPRQVAGKPAFAAFNDPGPATKGGYANYGEQLRAECDRARNLLLEHRARWDVNYWDVLDVDPPFAERLRVAQQKDRPELWLTALPSTLDPGDEKDVPPPESPKGGVPFQTLSLAAGVFEPTPAKMPVASRVMLAAGSTMAAVGLGSIVARRYFT